MKNFLGKFSILDLQRKFKIQKFRNEKNANEMLAEEECRVRPLVGLLDSSSTRDNVRKQISERLIELLRKNETTRKEFLSCNGVEAIINTINDNDNRELMASCVCLLSST